jgi:Recombinase
MEQRIRDLVTGELTLDYFMRRSAEGWKLASVEWVRETQALRETQPKDTTAGAVRFFRGGEGTAIPYGLRIAEQGDYLEENPLEATVLLLILEQIVKEKRISEIAIELNHAGYRTREGTSWSPTAVFNLLPRLIEVGPSVLKSAAWQAHRTEQKPN